MRGQGRAPWFVLGDINGFFGLMFDNMTVLSFLAGILIFAFGFPADIVYKRMFPGTAFGVLFGDMVYTWMAFRLAKRTGDRTRHRHAPGPRHALHHRHRLGGAGPGLPGAEGRGMAAREAAQMTWYMGMATMVLIGSSRSSVPSSAAGCSGWCPRRACWARWPGIGLALIGLIPLMDIFEHAPGRHAGPGPGPLQPGGRHPAARAASRASWPRCSWARRSTTRCRHWPGGRGGPALPAFRLHFGLPVPTLLFVQRPGTGPQVPAPGHPLRAPHRRGRHQRDRERPGGRGRLPHPRHPPGRGRGHGAGGRLRRRRPVHPLHRPVRLQAHGRARRLHAAHRPLHRPGRDPRLHLASSWS